MAIALSNPRPNPPQPGKAFNITASGTPPYEFSYSYGGGFFTRLPEQEDATMIITIQRGKAGETLYVNVKDGNGEKGTWSGIIAEEASKDLVTEELGAEQQ